MQGRVTSAHSPYNPHGVLWEALYREAKAAESALVAAQREALEAWLAAEEAPNGVRKGKLRKRAIELTEKALG